MKFFVIGISDEQKPLLPPEVAGVIATHRIFSGGGRHREIMANRLPDESEWIDITVPLDAVFNQYQKYDDIVVFASGDPLFYGFANTIRRKLPEAEIIVYPSFHSLQLLAHRVLLPYHDLHIVSLTGRPWVKFDEALILGYDKIGILTDNREHTPAKIVQRMLYYGYDNYTVILGELLGNREQERVFRLTLEEMADLEFASPNVMILIKTRERERPFGIPDKQFEILPGRPNMMTKMPVRLLTLGMLDLRKRSVFWDVGSCTGSVSVEAKLQFPHLEIVAFEKRPEGAELLENNARRWGTPGIQMVSADFMEVDLSNLPLPDAVFIGGYGGNMARMIDRILAVIRPGGTIVFNSVSAESGGQFREILAEKGLSLGQCTRIAVDEHNPIEVMAVEIPHTWRK